jgi:hypothetical protein
LHENVRDVVAGAEAAKDWRRYVQAYPWATVAAAMAVGYVVVPGRARRGPRAAFSEADLEAIRALVEQAGKAGTQPREPVRKSLLGTGAALLAPLAWRFAQNYAMAYLEQWVAQQHQQWQAHTGPRSAGADGPRQAAPPGGRSGGIGR